MDDDEFTPRLGKMRSRGKDARYLSLVVKAARRAARGRARGGQFDGSRIGRGAGVGRVLRTRRTNEAFRARRAVVKVRLVSLAGKGLGGAKAHLSYIQRDGVTREGDPGALYSATANTADGKEFIARGTGDRHQFRLIVSLEDGDQYPDLKPFVRRLMSAMEADLGTALDWVAVDHHNTGHPHSHIVIRGKDELGRDLVIAREYISHGLRERAGALATLDLGPRTDLEIEERARAETGAERLTGIDRQLLREMNGEAIVSARDDDPVRQSLRTGRLQKLARMGLAAHLGGHSWRLGEGLADTLRRVGERGDVIRTMQRELSARKLDRDLEDRVVFEPGRPDAVPVVGRLVARGLADEHKDRHYMLVDGVDGRLHYVDIGAGQDVEPVAEGAVLAVSPRSTSARTVDQTIAEVAAANGGRYTVDAHLRHDPGAQESFADAHVRRLEAMRRVTRNIEREPEGSWIITSDHLAKAEAFEKRQARMRPVDVKILSPVPLEPLSRLDAATWLDRELVAAMPIPLRDAGFGREVRVALAQRTQWLIAEDLAGDQGGEIRFRRNMLAALQRRELLRVAAGLAVELEKPFAEARRDEHVEGRLMRHVDLASGRHALLERAHDFTLVPWRPVLERHVGKLVGGVMREGGINWQVGRGRSIT